MLHPDTELRFISEEIGHGIFATRDIPKGTMTWVKDELDRVLTPEEVNAISGVNLENLLKYTYRNHEGNYYFCWDLTRFVNHSFTPNAMITPLGFEIAIKDIKRGEEITNDYGTLNIIEPFECDDGTHKRKLVRPDDLLHFHAEWDQLILSAMEYHAAVAQPLNKFLDQDQVIKLREIHNGRSLMPSILEVYYKGK